MTPRLTPLRVLGVSVLSVSLLGLSLTPTGLATASADTAAVIYPFDLGAASSYAILGGSAITSNGINTLSGSGGTDVGLSPSAAYTAAAGALPGIGTVNVANAAAAEAQADLLRAYSAASAAGPVSVIPGELGGTVLTPGAYTPGLNGVRNAAAFTMTTSFELDGQGDPFSVFIFQTDAAASTAASVTVNLTNGANPCHVYWVVGAAFSTGASTQFAGRIMAASAVSLGASTTVQGQVLGLELAPVTIGAGGAIINEACPAVPDTDWPDTIWAETDLAPMEEGVAYSDGVTAASSVNASFNPATDVSYSVSAGALPPGIQLNAQTGVISGTARMNGPFDWSIQAALRGHKAVTQTFSLTVAPASAPVSGLNLGTAEPYVILARSTIVTVGASPLAGTAGTDVGLSTTGALVGTLAGYPGIGTLNIANTAVDLAHADLLAAIATGNSLTAASLGAELGAVTLTPGTYESAAALGFTGELILDGQGDPTARFVIRTPAALVTAASARVLLVNGTQACNVYWVIGAAVTLGATTTFTGRILAGQGITVGAGTTVDGQLLTANQGVTLAGNTVTNDGCASPGSLSATAWGAALERTVLDGTGTQEARGSSAEWTIGDARGTGAAWALSLSSTDFVSAAGTVDLTERTIPASNLSLIPGPVTRGANTNSLGQLTALPVQLSHFTQSVIWSPGFNSGIYFLTPSYSLLIPANAFRPNYSGEIGNSPVNEYRATLTFTLG